MPFNAALDTIYKAQIQTTPHLAKAIDKRLSECTASETALINHISQQILNIAGDELKEFCAGYDWICKMVLQEELHFRRHGSYRLSRFEDANAQVYARPDIMAPYMKGLLLTQLWWRNHTLSIGYLRDQFLPRLPSGYSLLEVGPGHGLLLAYPANDPRCGKIEAWDLSEASLIATQSSLGRMRVSKCVNLKAQDLFDADPSAGFDAIVFSEVLEHLEQPGLALERLKDVLNPGGLIYIHMPINAPASDHLFNQDTPEMLADFVEDKGLEIINQENIPMNGYTLEQCRKLKLTISCLITAKRTETK